MWNILQTHSRQVWWDSPDVSVNDGSIFSSVCRMFRCASSAALRNCFSASQPLHTHTSTSHTPQRSLTDRIKVSVNQLSDFITMFINPLVNRRKTWFVCVSTEPLPISYHCLNYTFKHIKQFLRLRDINWAKLLTTSVKKYHGHEK